MLAVFSVGLTFAVAIGLVHYFNEKLFFKSKETGFKMKSFVAGVSATYLFLNLLPEVYEAVPRLDRWIFIAVLLGFALAHTMDKYFYQHSKGEDRMFRHKELHFLVFFAYYFILGAIFLNILEESFIRGILFAVPLLFYAAVSRISFAEIHGHLREKQWFRIMLSVSTLLGFNLAYHAGFDPIIFQSLIAFAAGAILHIIVNDFIPREAQGKPSYFLTGVLIYSILIGLSWTLG